MIWIKKVRLCQLYFVYICTYTVYVGCTVQLKPENYPLGMFDAIKVCHQVVYAAWLIGSEHEHEIMIKKTKKQKKDTHTCRTQTAFSNYVLRNRTRVR